MSSLEADLDQACQYLAQYGETIPQASTALLLFNILRRIAFFSESPAVLRSTSLLVVNQIIRVDWFDWRDIKVITTIQVENLPYSLNIFVRNKFPT